VTCGFQGGRLHRGRAPAGRGQRTDGERGRERYASSNALCAEKPGSSSSWSASPRPASATSRSWCSARSGTSRIRRSWASPARATGACREMTCARDGPGGHGVDPRVAGAARGGSARAAAHRPVRPPVADGAQLPEGRGSAGVRGRHEDATSRPAHPARARRGTTRCCSRHLGGLARAFASAIPSSWACCTWLGARQLRARERVGRRHRPRTCCTWLGARQLREPAAERASRAASRARRSGAGVRVSAVAASTIRTAVSGPVRQPAWTASGRVPCFVRTQ
jgi:hypothetical protein